jgi:hypothetical protein
MTDMIDSIGTWPVLKWVALVLIAGFIGQFGRMLAEAIIARVRSRRAKQASLPDQAKPPETLSIPPAGVSETALPKRPAAPADIPDKKMLKAMAKARKKEAKKK